MHLVMTCDADSDQATSPIAERTSLAWEGLLLLPGIVDELTSRGIHCTLFVRVDNQVGRIFGKRTAMVERLNPTIEKVIAGNGEIGWHPHLCDCRENGFFPTYDAERACREIEEVHADLKQSEFSIQTVRIGEAWHSNDTMQLLDSLGYHVDSTAIPGRVRHDEMRRFDWESTPNRPYRPSRSDYRLPGCRDALQIVEVPMTTAPMLTRYDRKPLRRYLNPTFRPELFIPAVKSCLASLSTEAPQHQVLIFVFHPGELLPLQENDLHIYGRNNFKKNLDRMQELLSASGEYDYSTLSRVAANAS